ncbi:hypothetical protein NDU88_004778 [Pleurodeles waltl]|uniref:Uncharacterized protein n=1 Tax=Pleurodeles waltl TaxID=8319 RepID=A0AAV7WVR5_PLEWA|nr:hypothetical protein NDU88_004778 [Pleurodeles waltl]
MYDTNRQGGNNSNHSGGRQQPGESQSSAHHSKTLQTAMFCGAVPTPTKAWREQSTEVKGLTIGDTGKNHTAMEPELQVFPMIFYVMLHLEHQRKR